MSIKSVFCFLIQKRSLLLLLLLLLLLILLAFHSQVGEMRWRSWLRHCTTSRKVAGSIPDGVIRISHRHNSSDRTMALRST